MDCADCRDWKHAFRHQFFSDDLKDALSWNDLDENAYFCLEFAYAPWFLSFLLFLFLTATLLMLTLDRYLGMHFFTAGGGGNPMMYVNLIWAWGHPEVYILILPAFGIFSEVVPTFSEKRLFGYISMVWALSCDHILSFLSGCIISLQWAQVLMSMLFLGL